MNINKEKNFVSAVVYLYNNEDSIVYFVDALNQVLNDNFEKYEIIIVNDNSDDNATNKIKNWAKTSQNSAMLSIINMSYFQGIEQCMNAGVELAIGDFVFEFDHQFIDYDTSLIMQTYFTSLQGFDIVSAKGKHTSISSSMFYKFYNKNSASQYKLDTESFRVLSRRAINRVNSLNKILPYRKAVYANSGLKIKTLTYTPQKNKNSNYAKKTVKKQQETAINSLILFTNLAHKISISFTVLMAAFTIAIGIYSIVVFLLGNPVEGYTTTMLVLSAGFFGMFTIMAIMMKYLSLLVDLVFKKQKYIIESIEKIVNE